MITSFYDNLAHHVSRKSGINRPRKPGAQNRERSTRPQPPLIGTGSSQEVEMKEMDNSDDVSRFRLQTSAKLHAQMNWLWNVDPETRRDYCSALMNGHGASLVFPRYYSTEFYLVALDIDYDPSLFEGAFPLNDSS
jgi:hypothetical protein